MTIEVLPIAEFVERRRRDIEIGKAYVVCRTCSTLASREARKLVVIVQAEEGGRDRRPQWATAMVEAAGVVAEMLGTESCRVSLIVTDDRSE